MKETNIYGMSNKQMEKIEGTRRKRILTQMNAKEYHLDQIRKENERSLSKKREENRRKEMEKKRNVNKILDQQEKERQNTLKRLEQKSRSIQALQKEKNSNKWAIEKQNIVDQFEKMKKTGRINVKVLNKMGVELPSKKELKESLKMKTTRASFTRTTSGTNGFGQRRLSQPIGPKTVQTPARGNAGNSPRGLNSGQSKPVKNNFVSKPKANDKNDFSGKEEAKKDKPAVTKSIAKPAVTQK